MEMDMATIMETIKTNLFVREVDVGDMAMDMAPVVTLEIMEETIKTNPFVREVVVGDMAPVVTLEIMEDLAVTLGDVPVEQNVTIMAIVEMDMSTIMEMDMATIMEMDMAPVVV